MKVKCCFEFFYDFRNNLVDFDYVVEVYGFCPSLKTKDILNELSLKSRYILNIIFTDCHLGTNKILLVLLICVGVYT